MQKKRCAAGFTLCELIVAVALGMLVLGGLYRVFTMQNRTISVQEQIADMHQSARTSMEIMLRDIRMAGYNPTKTATWSGAQPGLTVATANSLSFAADLNGDGSIASASGAEEDIGYEIYIEGGASFLGRTVNGTRRAVAKNIESLVFVYYDRDGNVLSSPPPLSAVKKIQATVTAKTDRPDFDYLDPTRGDNYRRYSLTFQVAPRNLGL